MHSSSQNYYFILARQKKIEVEDMGILNFQCQKSRLQDNKAKGERSTIKRARRRSGSCYEWSKRVGPWHGADSGIELIWS